MADGLKSGALAPSEVMDYAYSMGSEGVMAKVNWKHIVKKMGIEGPEKSFVDDPY